MPTHTSTSQNVPEIERSQGLFVEARELEILCPIAVDSETRVGVKVGIVDRHVVPYVVCCGSG